MDKLPDSGDRTNFDTGAKRDASIGKGIPSEIPPMFIRSVALRLEQGAEKYDRGNWRKGIPLSRYQDAITRHTLLAAEGDTSEDHYGAIGFNAAGWQWTLAEINAGRLPRELNDLPFHKDNHDMDTGEPEASGKAKRIGFDVGPSRGRIWYDGGLCQDCGLQLSVDQSQINGRHKHCGH